MRFVHVTLALAAMLLATTAGWGQDPGYRPEASPFGEEFVYLVPNELRPMVEVGGLRLALVRIAAKEGKEITPGEAIPYTMTVDVENASDSALQALLVVLLENAAGKQLERLEVPKIKLKAGGTESITGKYRSDGRVLQDTAKVWIFLEIL